MLGRVPDIKMNVAYLNVWAYCATGASALLAFKGAVYEAEVMAGNKDGSEST